MGFLEGLVQQFQSWGADTNQFLGRSLTVLRVITAQLPNQNINRLGFFLGRRPLIVRQGLPQAKAKMIIQAIPFKNRPAMFHQYWFIISPSFPLLHKLKRPLKTKPKAGVRRNGNNNRNLPLYI